MRNVIGSLYAQGGVGRFYRGLYPALSIVATSRAVQFGCTAFFKNRIPAGGCAPCPCMSTTAAHTLSWTLPVGGCSSLRVPSNQA
jgi:hypothetical protein